MKTLQFKVTLLSDVIINQRAATEGNQKTLDFIPGNAFLGVAAGQLYKDTNDDSFILFHSGKVRFGDAHPLVDGKRALKVPAAWFFPKGKDKSNLFVHHGMPKPDENKIDFQPKQCRDSFIVKSTDNTVEEVEIKKHFAIKSAYDSDKRRSEDAKMYGYESLQAGSQWCFDVVVDDDLNTDLEEKLIKALEGKKRVGRSSTAQYGLVEIKEEKNPDYGFGKWSQPKARSIEGNLVFVYAESRLIFFDKYGQPTFKPAAEQLGFPGGKICWDMSQIRTFQYAPYNNHRQTRDTDRLGIEKGSVFCITDTSCPDTEKWVGSYQNEGFGKVLINPDFLEFVAANGEAKYSFANEKAKNKTSEVSSPSIQTDDKPVIEYLKKQKLQKENQKFIYEKVNAFVKDNERNFKGDSFASQWGTIRSLAMQFRDPVILKDKIFKNNEGYLMHGVAAEKWSERGRIALLKKFTSLFKNNDEGKENKEHLLSEAMINLAAEMAKKCRRD